MHDGIQYISDDTEHVNEDAHNVCNVSHLIQQEHKKGKDIKCPETPQVIRQNPSELFVPTILYNFLEWIFESNT